MPCQVDVTGVADLLETARLLRAEAGEAVGIGSQAGRSARTDRIGGRIADADRIAFDPPLAAKGDVERFDAADGQAIDEVGVEVGLPLGQATQIEAGRAGRPERGVERLASV